MQKLLCIFLLFGIHLSIHSQTIEFGEEKLKETLCKTWVFDYGTANGQILSGSEKFETLTYTFCSNNTYKTKSRKAKGKWEYNESEKCVEMSLKNKIDYRITLLNQEKLVLKPISYEIDPGVMNDLEFHFKVINYTSSSKNAR